MAPKSDLPTLALDLNGQGFKAKAFAQTRSSVFVLAQRKAFSVAPFPPAALGSSPRRTTPVTLGGQLLTKMS